MSNQLNLGLALQESNALRPLAAAGWQQERDATSAASAFGLRIENRELAISILEGMRQVEMLLGATVASDHQLVHELSGYLLAAGGKRLRPLITLLAAQFGDAGRAEVIAAAAACELTHIATLYHDDVMDEADVRRDVPAANVRYGNTVAVLTGDLLFARAAQLVSQVGIEAVRIQIKTATRLVAGQTRETVGRDGSQEIDRYLATIADKTASLTSACTWLGALASGCPPWMVACLREYGELIGIAFQISDDLLDITQTRDTTGKEPGQDLREGIDTLPVLYLRSEPQREDARLLELLDGDLSEPETLAEALRLLSATAAMRRARQDLASSLSRARSCLEDLPDVPARNAFGLLCDVIGDRSG